MGDPMQGACVCRRHPCWDDEGKAHSCVEAGAPYLQFHYDKDGTLKCGCGPLPHYASTHIYRDKCAGHHCEMLHPVLDWEEATQSCICRQHPCWNDHGLKHECSDAR